MARVLGTFMIIVVFLACAASHAIAEPTLFLGSASAQPGGTTTLDLSISGDTGAYAGINARIVFDTDKVQVTGVSQGTGLSSGSFTVDYGTATVNGHSEATVIAYSDQNTFSGSSGVLLKLNLQVDASAAVGTLCSKRHQSVYQRETCDIQRRRNCFCGSQCSERFSFNWNWGIC